MASSTLEIIKESLREGATADDKFYKKPVYFFELKVPDTVGIFGTTFMFPLMLNPQEITMEEPFTLEAQPTQGGGLYIEENGIVQRVLRIRGHTGFKPRNLEATFGLAFIESPQKPSFSRKPEFGPTGLLGGLSGQKHFQWLQDRVFRTYADLKRDPTTSEDTKLIFHNQKDDEHWLVAPRQFTMNRSAARPTLYEYNIELLVLDSATAEVLDLSEDKGILDSIKDAIRTVKGYVDMIKGAIQDISAAIGEIRQIIANIDTLISSVGEIVDAATDFVNGVTDLINTPLSLVKSAIGVVEKYSEFLTATEELENAANSLPDNLRESFRQLEDALEGLGSYPEKFVEPSGKAIAIQRDKQNLALSASTTALRAAADFPPTTLDQFRQLGTGLMPGDALRAQAETKVGAAVEKFTSVKEQKLRQGDTLQSLAAKYLGDARLWKYIAMSNGLRPPFVTDLGVRDLVGGDPLPGTLGRGDKILIPSFSPPPKDQAIPTTYGVESEEPNEVHLLGVDLMLVSTDGGKTYDIPINVEGGSVDAKVVRGIDNLAQGIRTRLETERGHDLLYRFVGMQRIIGMSNRLIDLETAKFRVAEAVTLDPRIAGLRALRFSESSTPDQVVVDMDVEVRGFSEPIQVQTEVR